MIFFGGAEKACEKIWCNFVVKFSVRVIEDLTLLAELYSKVKDRSGVEKTSREIEGIEDEFAKTQDCYQEYLDAKKDKISSKACGVSVKMRTLHTQEAKAR